MVIHHNVIGYAYFRYIYYLSLSYHWLYFRFKLLIEKKIRSYQDEFLCTKYLSRYFLVLKFDISTESLFLDDCFTIHACKIYSCERATSINKLILLRVRQIVRVGTTVKILIRYSQNYRI